MKPTVLLALVLVTATLADEIKPPPRADVRGVVKEVKSFKGKGPLGRVRVEGVKHKDTRYARGYATVLPGLSVYLWKGGKKVEADFGDIKVGCVVQIVYEDKPVVTNGVPSAVTGDVLILPMPKKKR